MGVTTDPGGRLRTIVDGVASGQIKALVALGENPIDIGLTLAQVTSLPAFLVMNILSNETTHAATALLPSLGFAEKRGSMINRKGRLQRLNRAVRGPGQAREDWQILRDLIEAYAGRNSQATIRADDLQSIEDVFRHMSESIPQFAGLNLSKISDLGLQILNGAVAPSPESAELGSEAKVLESQKCG
jgi:NADH-quinone oxidoreductase subunit G